MIIVVLGFIVVHPSFNLLTDVEFEYSLRFGRFWSLGARICGLTTTEREDFAIPGRMKGKSTKSVLQCHTST